LVTRLDGALGQLATSHEELRELDSAIGDGDLGITVSKGAEAIRLKLAGLEDPTLPGLLRAAATAFSAANPSTFAALVGGGLLAAAKAVGSGEPTGRDAVAVGRAAVNSIASRGKSQVGDKTVLDPLVASIDALEPIASRSASGTQMLEAMVSRARDAVTATASLQSRRGRAAWLGERSLGHPDPGATAYLRFLEALSAEWARREAGAA
jgi:dihydroxyacetone kinase-like protein